MENKIPVRFFITTFMCSWLFLIPCIILIRTGIIVQGSSLYLALQVIAGFFVVLGPAVGAFTSICSIEGKGAIKIFIRKFLSLNFGWKIWLAIFFVPAFFSFFAWIIPEFFGEARLSSNLPNIYIFPIYLLFCIFLSGGLEEIGWRGYIMPYLEKRFGLIIGSLLLGIIWAIWHLPLWFIPGTPQAYMNFFMFMFVCIAYSYFFSWIIKASGNRLFSGMVAHGVVNAFLALFPFVNMSEGAKQPRFWIYCISFLVVGIIITIIRTCKSRKYGT